MNFNLTKIKSHLHFLRRHWIITGVIILAIFGGLIYKANSATAPKVFVKAENRDISQTVRVTGTVKPTDAVKLAFERGGKVARVFVRVGDRVRVGQPLVALGAADVAAQYSQATAALEQTRAQIKSYEAALQSQRARLEELQNGSRPEEIQAAESDVERAQLDVSNDTITAQSTITSVSADVDAVLHTKLAGVFSGSAGNGYQFTFNACETQAASEATQGRQFSEYAFVDLQKISATDPVAALTMVKEKLSIIKKMLDSATNVVTAGCLQNVGGIDTHRTNISTARTAIAADMNTITQALQNISAHAIALQKAQSVLNLKKAGNTSQTIAMQEAAVAQASAALTGQTAAVKSAEARVMEIGANLSKFALQSPIDGLVTAQDATLGEIVGAGAPVVSVISDQKLEIEAYVTESDVDKVHVGNPVTITLDAISDATFHGHVVYVEPAETVMSGVVNFKVKIIFDQFDPRFKSGFTANLVIETLKKTGVVVLPQYTIVENDQGNFVQLKNEADIVETPVKIGIRSDDGLVEILSGVEAGDEVENIGFKTK